MSALGRGRDAHRSRAWREACALLQTADEEGPLGPDDLMRLSEAAQLAGLDDLSDATRQRLFHQCEESGDAAGAARAAFMLGMALMTRGEPAQGGAWIGRSIEKASALAPDQAERGYVLIPQGLAALGSGDAVAAIDRFGQAREIGAACDDTDLVTLALLGVGQSLLSLGRIEEGLEMFDRAMVAVVSEEVSDVFCGIVYCAVVEGCHNIGDLARSREWTRALSAWCDQQPDLVPFRGRCLVHRSEILQLDGSWPAATDEALRACAVLSDPPGQPPLAAALYQLAEMQRLRGAFATATQSYRQASEHGLDPQPGLALLRLATGNADAAEATLARVLAEGRRAEARPALLGAHVEVAIAAGRHDAAQRSAEELDALAAGEDIPASLRARRAVAVAQVALAAGDAAAALGELRDAAGAWSALGAVYEHARTRELIARACLVVGDLDSADLEANAARATYERLGAAPDVTRVDTLTRADAHGAAAGSGLTGRELEVLRHLARGGTNRQIAEDLFISEKTVARHIANIFTKVGVSTRSAATAYAYDHDLV